MDNIISTEEGFSDYRIMMSFMLEAFSSFLISIEHPAANEVLDYEMNFLDFPGREETPNHVDCGVFLMMAMQHFDGTKITCDLSKVS